MDAPPMRLIARRQTSWRGASDESPKNELAVRRVATLTIAMADYGQFCPVSRGAEIFAERWTPLILRELLNGSQRFSELRLGLPRISRNLLTQRLTALASAGVIERRPAIRGRGFSYHLTAAGEELRPVVEALGAGGYVWGGAAAPTHALKP